MSADVQWDVPPFQIKGKFPVPTQRPTEGCYYPITIVDPRKHERQLKENGNSLTDRIKETGAADNDVDDADNYYEKEEDYGDDGDNMDDDDNVDDEDIDH
ncbi:hypothetical protein DPMN_096240 [Dreissena polymorpha]|uniref:Uncharacterized protein n=1 Tax=Dreissena polymorpha TaxID=45954 RepID=A0A9D4R4A7_DREPO|nr:hypothetical protein DPMN_096240 [Dreissena polymorpha]